MRFYRSETYASYWFLSMQSFLGKRGDSYDRFLIRVREMYESIHIVFQVLANLTNNHRLASNSKNTDVDFLSFFDFLYKVKKNQLNKKTKYTSMENLISHFKKYSEGMKVPKGFTYNAVEAPKGEFGVYLISDGSSKPYRCKIRAPGFSHLQAMDYLIRGHMLADVPAVLGSLDIVFGEVDR